MENLHKILLEFFKSKGLEERFYEYQVIKEWHKIIGEGLAKDVEAVDCKDGILYLFSTDSLLRSEIYSLKREIIKSINRYFNKKIVKDLKFIRRKE
ncbi:MAG: DUF721 domain-containing protein [Candidatus Hydrothermales bacterium]